MKKLLSGGLLLLCNVLTAQNYSSDTFTSIEFNEHQETQNNLTTITLFSFDFNGEKIPINLIYNHSGLQVNETPGALGFGWQLQNIGIINRIVNDEVDNEPDGWFNTLDPNFSAGVASTYCNVFDCPTIEGGYSGNDLSPDFFSMQTSSGRQCDFLYKKSVKDGIPQLPIPMIISNADGYRIDTQFSNFVENCSDTENVSSVFDVIDKNGNHYNFINGPIKKDTYRNNNANCRNDFYLAAITNPTRTDDSISIEYNKISAGRNVWYATGFNNYNSSMSSTTQNNMDYNGNIIGLFGQDYFFESRDRYDIKKITAKSAVINFIYSASSGYLDEIEIKDAVSGSYITGYKFEYNRAFHEGEQVYQILKYDRDKLITQIIYEFDYFADMQESDFVSETSMDYDFFGYFNNSGNTTRFPFQIRAGSLLPAANSNPALVYARLNNLKSITSKYGGKTEFDYQLKTDVMNDWYYTPIYAGGLIISSKKVIPNIGKPKLTVYTYENLHGYVVDTESPARQFYRFAYDNKKFWSSRPILIERDEIHPSSPTPMANNHIAGSFYKKIIETVYDFDTMTALQSNIKEFIPDYEGFFKRPLLAKETIQNEQGNMVKQTEYLYSQSLLESIPRATCNKEIRLVSTTWYGLVAMTLKPIQVIRTNLISKITKTATNNGEFSEKEDYVYASTSKSLRSKSKEGIETKYLYATDIEMAGEPFRVNLITANIIGEPLSTITSKSAQKLAEIKNVYAKDASTVNLLKQKYTYSKKGADNIGSPEKVFTCDIYDARGNILQYTKEKGKTVSQIWGYNKTKIIAVVENASYSQIAGALGISVASLNLYNESNIATLNSLRTSLPNAMVKTYVHDPLIGITSAVDPKGETTTYNYDKFGRLSQVLDRFGNILSENEYSYNLQN
jgi:YD repeat-containing protein